MDNKKVASDVRELIDNKMNNEGRTLKWLADKTEINYNTLHACIVRKLFTLSSENLIKINEALETDFTLPTNGTEK